MWPNWDKFYVLHNFTQHTGFNMWVFFSYIGQVILLVHSAVDNSLLSIINYKCAQLLFLRFQFLENHIMNITQLYSEQFDLTDPVLYCPLCRQRSSCREGCVQPDHQLWSPASCRSRCAASSPGAQRRVRQEMWSSHWPASPWHRETHWIQDLPAGIELLTISVNGVSLLFNSYLLSCDM